ncbi:MAG: PrsW family intramembrane metalloprotease [Thermoflexales bacterium]|nr:PrsW family intramembrane metalloprotease [Thermoflexales bacterium]
MALSNSSINRPSSAQLLGLFSVLAGGLVAAGGVIMAVLLVFSAQLQVSEAGIGDIALPQAVAVGALGVCLGLVLIAEGVRKRRGTPSRPFRFRRFGWLWLAFAVLLVAGTIVSVLNAPPLLMALIHAPTLLLLPALVLTLVGWGLRGRGVSWSDVSGGLLAGALLGTGTALVIEAILMVFLAVALFALGLLPQEWLQQAPQALAAGEIPFPAEVEGLLDGLTPPLMLIALVFIGGLVPLVEEATKTLGVGLAGAWLRPSPARAFLLGVASGAGFALAENILNSVFTGPAWGPAVLARLMATVMHCATGGLMGWGWGQWWAGRRPWRLPLAFVGAATAHSLWNSCAAGAALLGLMALTRTGDPVWMGLAGLLLLTLLGMLFLLACGVAVTLLWASHRLGRSAL